MKNQPETMKNHENRPGTMKNQPETMKNHENQPGTMKNHENRPGTMKNQPGTMKNRPGIMKNWPGTFIFQISEHSISRVIEKGNQGGPEDEPSFLFLTVKSDK